MSTTAQIEANRQNAQHSSGPKTEAGKAASSQNNSRHGLAGGLFQVLPWEDQEDYKDLLTSLFLQHDPQTDFEMTLVQKIAQHFWLSQRAVRLQELCFDMKVPMWNGDNDLKLYLRYQATHDRAYHKLSDEIRKLRKETRRAQIGFESQKREQAAETRRTASEERRQNEEIRRAAAEIRRENAESRQKELHSKRLALLDAQIQRLAAPKLLNLSTDRNEAALLSEPKTQEMRSQAA